MELWESLRRIRLSLLSIHHPGHCQLQAGRSGLLEGTLHSLLITRLVFIEFPPALINSWSFSAQLRQQRRGQLRAPGPTGGHRLGQGEHPGLWRRSQQDHFGGPWDWGEHGVASHDLTRRQKG